MSRAVILAAALLAACSFEPDYGETRYVCRLDRCPEGYVCIDEVCVTGAADAAGHVGIDAAPDAAAEDASSDAAMVPSCDDQFGSAPAYAPCGESDTTCSFDVMTNGTCDDLCASFGETCAGAIDSDSGIACDEQGPTTCGTAHSSQICECTRGGG